VHIENCTFCDNTAPLGAGLQCEQEVVIANSIIAFNRPGEGIRTGPSIQISCSDIFGNEGGDWVGELADDRWILGNLCADPLFCGRPDHDYTIQADSPCNRQPCGFIGASPVGCPVAGLAATPTLTSWRVIPNPTRGACTIEFAGRGDRLEGSGPAMETGSMTGTAVGVSVFDSGGRVVRELGHHGPEGSGRAVALVWDGRDAAGRPAPSGMYHVRSADGQRAAVMVVR